MMKLHRPGLLAFAVILPLFTGGLSAILAGDMMKEYFFMNKPALSPPGWIFPIVWSFLYIMMGLASYLVMSSGANRVLLSRAIIFYGAQLLLNFLWSLLFFNHSLYLAAFVELIAMWVTVVITAVMFFRASKAAGILMVPYILWLTFAGYLNFAVYRLSITPMPLPK